MVWQDIIISAANIVFVFSLVPQVYRGFRKRRGFISSATSVPTFAGLYIMSFCYLTLSLPYSAVLTFFTGTLWLLLFVQKAIYKEA